MSDEELRIELNKSDGGRIILYRIVTRNGFNLIQSGEGKDMNEVNFKIGMFFLMKSDKVKFTVAMEEK